MRSLYAFIQERVTTIDDECSRVGHQHGESPSPKYPAQKWKIRTKGGTGLQINLNGIYQSKRCGPIRILTHLGYDKYKIQFIRTGTVKTARGSAIKEGNIRDPFAKLNCGVACTGNIPTRGKYGPYYTVWNSMVHRCYAEQDGKYRIYANTTVCDRWLVFANFYEDCKSIDGFDEAKFLRNELVLDKDLKQRHQTHKVYSPETCTWLTKAENARYQDGQMRPFIAISPDGQQYQSDNISQFAREHGLTRRHISGVLHGRAKTTGGWTFHFCEDIA